MLALLASLVCSEAVHTAAPARVSSLEGAALIRESSGARDLALNEPLTSGATLETSAGTLLEIEIAGGTFVRVGGGSAIHLDRLGLDTEVTLLSGSLTADPGPRARAFVYGAQGERLLEGRGGVESGAREDATRFLSWSDVRDRDAAGTLRDALVGEWELERNGEWLVVDGRRAWRPRVDPSWRPYRDGEWRDLSWGWTWLPDETWGFVTVHQGRWIRHRTLGWLWFRGDDWSPAWVKWDSRAGETLAWAPCSPAHIEFRPDPAIWLGVDLFRFGPCDSCGGGRPAPVRLYRAGQRENPQPGNGRHNDNGTDDGDGTGHHDDRGDDSGKDGGRGGRGNDDDSGTGGDDDDDGGEQGGGRGNDDDSGTGGDDDDDGGEQGGGRGGDDDSGTGGDDDDDGGEQGGGRGDDDDHDDNGHGNDDDHDDDSNPGQGGGGHGSGNNGGGNRHRDGGTTRAPAAVTREGWALSNRTPEPGRNGWSAVHRGTGANRAPLANVRPFAESSRPAWRSDAPQRSQFAATRSQAPARFHVAAPRGQQTARAPQGPPRSQLAAPHGQAPARSQVAPRAFRAPARSQGSPPAPSRAPSNQHSSRGR